MTQVIQAREPDAGAFFERYAAAGRVGLVGGSSPIDRAIQIAQKPLMLARKPDEQPSGSSEWSHAFLFQGRRADGQHWVIESDLDVHRKHVRLGVQENRADKYHAAEDWPRLAVIDFGLSEAQTALVMATALDMVARRVRYSLRELAGTLLAMHRPHRRSQENVLAREHAIFCSAFVLHACRAAGHDLVPGVDVKHAAPEDLARSPLVRTMWVLERA